MKELISLLMRRLKNMLISNFFKEILSLTISVSPYLLIGFLFSGFLSVMISQDEVERHLGKNQGFLGIFKASLFGIPLPLCSCSVIPVSASLKKHGASKGSVTSFLLSTPQTGVDSITLTYGLLGPVIAIVRPIIALIVGIIGGVAVNSLDDKYIEEENKKCHDTCCKSKSKSTLNKILTYSFITLPKDIAKPLIYGIIIAALISLFLPVDIIHNYMGGGIISMILMIIIGTPLYICATASIPIAVALISKGASIGSALVFLMVGPATNTTSIVTMLKIIGKKSTVIVLITLTILSVGFGLIIDSVDIIQTIPSSNHHHHEHYSMMDYFLSIILMGILINAIYPIRRDV